MCISISSRGCRLLDVAVFNVGQHIVPTLDGLGKNGVNGESALFHFLDCRLLNSTSTHQFFNLNIDFCNVIFARSSDGIWNMEELVVLSSARMFERSWMQLHPSIHNTSISAARKNKCIPPASAPILLFEGPLGPPQAKVRRANFDSLFYSNKKSGVNTPTIKLLSMLLVKHPVVNCIHVDSK